MQHHPTKTLNFPIKRLSADDLQQATIVHQWGYTPFSQKPGENKKELVIVTPLHPCTAIIAYDKIFKRGIALHAHFSSSIESGVKTIKHELDLNSSSNPEYIQIFTLSKKMNVDDYNLEWKEWHQEKSQEEHMVFVNEQLISGLDISADQLCTGWLSKKPNGALRGNTKSRLIDRSVIIDGKWNKNDLEIKQADLADVEPLFDGFKLHAAALAFAKESHRFRSISEFSDKIVYNQLPFNKISGPSAVAITKLPAHSSNPWDNDF
jgi:hypothetical protein